MNTGNCDFVNAPEKKKRKPKDIKQKLEMQRQRKMMAFLLEWLLLVILIDVAVVVKSYYLLLAMDIYAKWQWITRESANTQHLLWCESYRARLTESARSSY